MLISTFQEIARRNFQKAITWFMHGAADFKWVYFHHDWVFNVVKMGIQIEEILRNGYHF